MLAKTNLYPQVQMVRGEGEGGPEMAPKEPLHLMVLVWGVASDAAATSIWNPPVLS